VYWALHLHYFTTYTTERGTAQTNGRALRYVSGSSCTTTKIYAVSFTLWTGPLQPLQRRTMKRDPRNSSASGRSERRSYFWLFVYQSSPNFKCACAGEIAVCNAVSVRRYVVSFRRYSRSSCNVVRNLPQIFMLDVQTVYGVHVANF